jgi:hypothetical protein
VEGVAMAVQTMPSVQVELVSVATRAVVQGVARLVTLVWVASAVQAVLATVVGLV